MLGFRSNLSSKVRQASTARKARIVSVKAANLGSLGDNGEAMNAAAMALLLKRIENLKSAGAALDSYRQAIERRPPVPQGTQNMMWDEMKMDHDLLCSWHESAWCAMSNAGPPELTQDS